MIALDQVLADYLRIRRAMGHQLVRDGKLLAQFLLYLDVRGAQTITTELALGWATLPTAPGTAWPANRLGVARRFARYAQTIDPAIEVPPPGLLKSGRSGLIPYLYSPQDLAALLGAAGALSNPLRAATYQTLFGLLAVTGMRIGEAIALNRGDIDIERGVLTVRHAKFGKSRELALHPSTIRALGGYQRRRDELCPSPNTAAVFVSPAGTRLIYNNTNHTFLRLLRSAGLKPRSACCRPRLHDLRHTFAVSTILDAYARGEDVQKQLALLGTYLGHVDPVSTYWYLSASSELMALAGERLERYLEDLR